MIGYSEPGDRFGSGLASCDFNRDGYADLVIGANGERTVSNPNPAGPRGAVSVVYGSSQVLKTSGNDIFNPASFGLTESWGSVLECGYLNGDGYPDLAIGHGFCCHLEPHRGGVMVFYGSAQGLDDQSVTHLTWEPAIGPPEYPDSYRFGQSVAIGDLDSDGIEDLAVPTVSGTRIYFGAAGGVQSGHDHRCPKRFRFRGRYR